VELRALVAVAEHSAVLLDAGCQGAEVLYGFGNSLRERVMMSFELKSEQKTLTPP
jgi:hypothetical protein